MMTSTKGSLFVNHLILIFLMVLSLHTSSTVLGTYKSPILTQCLKDIENCLFIILFVPMYVYVHCWINIQYHLSTDFPGDHGLKSSGPCLGTLPAGA